MSLDLSEIILDSNILVFTSVGALLALASTICKQTLHRTGKRTFGWQLLWMTLHIFGWVILSYGASIDNDLYKQFLVGFAGLATALLVAHRDYNICRGRAVGEILSGLYSISFLLFGWTASKDGVESILPCMVGAALIVLADMGVLKWQRIRRAAILVDGPGMPMKTLGYALIALGSSYVV